MPSKEPGPPPDWTRLAGIGFEFAASLVVFMLLGFWVDRHWQIQGHWGVLIGLLLGLIGGTYNFVREVAKALRESNRQTRPRGPADGSADEIRGRNSDDTDRNEPT